MSPSTVTDTVVKVGGALLSQPNALESVLLALEAATAQHQQLLIVSGGGPFADTVRKVDQTIGLDPDAAHWMAILGMEQYALLLLSRMSRALRVEHPADLENAYLSHQLPVLAPFCWLRREDPLPHSWDVTSDSIAAWVAGEVGARRLILVKPVIGQPTALVDPYFEQILPRHVRAIITDAHGITGALRET